MTRFLLALAFVISIIALPWWASLAVAILYLAEKGNPLLIIIGGILFDTLFGAPIASLHGFSYLYTLIAVALSATALFLRQTLFE